VAKAAARLFPRGFAAIAARDFCPCANENPMIVALVSAFGAEFLTLANASTSSFAAVFRRTSDAQEFVFRFATMTIPA
jgi:hypothetical protein